MHSIIDFELLDCSLTLKVGPNTFVPNLTTRLLAETVAGNLAGKRVLDIGCGVGPIALYAAKNGAEKVCAVDLMPEACELARENVALNGLTEDQISVIQGDLFAPLTDEKFDIIIDDVSGMSEDISRISPWYPDTIPTGGEDGTGPTLRMLEQAPNYLTDSGVLVFPVLSLARAGIILSKARDVYGNTLMQLSSKRIPFCHEFKERLDRLTLLRERGLIDFTQLRSRFFWTLDIYQASNPRFMTVPGEASSKA